MRRMTRWMMVFSVCLAAAPTGMTRGEDKKPVAKPLDRRSLDEAIYARLREVIDHGASLYNQGDWNGCYRLWEGALLALKPVLDHRPKLQESIESGIANARQEPMLWRRAWVLRPILNKIRADIDADYPHRRKNAEGAPPLAGAKPKSKKLWDRLGGEAGVTRIIDDFINFAIANPKVDFFRHNKVKLDAEQIVAMKRQFVEQFSQATGGPLKYTGPDLKTIHKGMGISAAQFNAATADLKKALEKNKVAAEDVKIILDAVGRHGKEIVEPKKTGEKKPEDKKPEATASITGKVTYKGKPAAEAKISFVAADGKAISAAIAANGDYQLAVKPGEYTIAVSGPAKLGLPARYAGANTSGLKFNVIKGKQNYDIALQ